MKKLQQDTENYKMNNTNQQKSNKKHDTNQQKPRSCGMRPACGLHALGWVGSGALAGDLVDPGWAFRAGRERTKHVGARGGVGLPSLQAAR